MINNNKMPAYTGLKEIDPRIDAVYQTEAFNYPGEEAGCMKGVYNNCGILPKIICCPLAPCGKGPVRQIESGQVGLKIEFGKVTAKLPPGLHTINTCSESVKIIDIRSFMVDTDSQSLITSDGIVLTVNSFAVCKVVNPEVFYFLSEKPRSILKIFLLTEIASIVSKNTLDSFMSERERWEKESLERLNKQSYSTGVYFELVEI